MNLFLRVFADCQTTEDAASLQSQLLAALGQWRPRPRAEPQQYWKMPQYFEFTYNLVPPSQEALEAIHSQAQTGWHDTHSLGEHSCVWNRTPGTQFLVPAVAWAELALHQ